VSGLGKASRPLFLVASPLLLLALAFHYRGRPGRPCCRRQRSCCRVERDMAAAEPGAQDAVTALKISGKVQAFGAPVTSGVLHVVVEDIVTQHYLAGKVVNVTDGGFGEIDLAIPKTGKAQM
jgi:hypothetical protein